MGSDLVERVGISVGLAFYLLFTALSFVLTLISSFRPRTNYGFTLMVTKTLLLYSLFFKAITFSVVCTLANAIALSITFSNIYLLCNSYYRFPIKCASIKLSTIGLAIIATMQVSYFNVYACLWFKQIAIMIVASLETRRVSRMKQIPSTVVYVMQTPQGSLH